VKIAPFQIQMKPRRRLQAVELYSRKYYDTCVRSGVQSEIANRNLPRKEVLAVIKRHTHDAFDAESDEIKQEIYDKLGAEKEKKDSVDEFPADRGPEDYAM